MKRYLKIERGQGDYSYLPIKGMSALCRKIWHKNPSYRGEVIEAGGGVRDGEAFIHAERDGRLLPVE